MTQWGGQGSRLKSLEMMPSNLRADLPLTITLAPSRIHASLIVIYFFPIPSYSFSNYLSKTQHSGSCTSYMAPLLLDEIHEFRAQPSSERRRSITGHTLQDSWAGLSFCVCFVSSSLSPIDSDMIPRRTSSSAPLHEELTRDVLKSAFRSMTEPIASTLRFIRYALAPERA